jgi:hypothetical protein
MLHPSFHTERVMYPIGWYRVGVGWLLRTAREDIKTSRLGLFDHSFLGKLVTIL